MQAMILAAGFGTRLLPHTRFKPKPLFPILNEPLLLLTIKRLQNYGFNRIIVNCHHLKEQIVKQLQGIEGIIVQEEENILGTGGGLRRALQLMNDEPLLVTNGDIYHTVDYQKLYAEHNINDRPATLAIHDYPRFNSVNVEGEYIVGFGKEDNSSIEKLAFTGLYVLDPHILETIEDGVESCIVESYRRLLQQGETLGAYRVDNCFWTDMGTPNDYLLLHEGLLLGTIPRWSELREVDGPIVVSPKSSLTGNTRLEQWCSIGRATGNGVKLSRVVVWDDVQLPDGFSADNTLISQTFI